MINFDPPSRADGIWHALEIQTRVKPRDWPLALLAVPEDKRSAAETYLRNIAALMRINKK